MFQLVDGPVAPATVGSVVAFASLAIWCVLVFARGSFWRVTLPGPSPAPIDWPCVVAVIPARNEAELIATTLGSVLGQDYPGPLLVYLVDDHSSDGTAGLARTAGARSNFAQRLQVVPARDLPAGWSGKVWAQSEGLRAAGAASADHDYVWLTDADVEHDPHALRQLVARSMDEKRVLTSLMVRLRCKSLPERALIPAFVFFFAKLYPFRRVNDASSKTAAAAGGCMLVESCALEAIGGIAAIRDALIDDCALAAALKSVGSIRLELADCSRSLRSYPNWGDIWGMVARTAFTQLRYSGWLLGGTVLGMALTYAAPPLLSLALPPRDAWPALLAWALMTLSYLPMLRYYRVSPAWAAAVPLIALFYLGATIASAVRYWRGKGGQWKGRAQAPLGH